MKSIEIILDHRCNARCVFCSSGSGAGLRSFTTNEVFRELAQAYEQGAREVYIGGGEPTLNNDLERIIQFSKQLGFRQCTLKTNGMLLCYPSITDRFIAAGVDLFMLPVWGDAELHDSFAQVDGAYEKMEIAVKNIVDSNARVELDLLIMRSTVPTLLGTIDRFVRMGVLEFSLWYLSLYGLSSQDHVLHDELPSYSEVAPVLRSIVAQSRKSRACKVMISDSDIPPCINIGTSKRMYVRSKDIRIIYPGGSKADPFDGGYKLPGCVRCQKNKECFGVRRDYVDIFGTDEFIPISARRYV